MLQTAFDTASKAYVEFELKAETKNTFFEKEVSIATPLSDWTNK